jgi:hypothetical protein
LGQQPHHQGIVLAPIDEIFGAVDGVNAPEAIAIALKR